MIARTRTVSEVTNTISDIIDFDLSLKNLAVEGQISNLSKSSAGHYYFNLIDEKALIKCVFFRGVASKNTVSLKEGASLVVCGKVQVYKAGGYHQIIVTRILESKESYMQKMFLELKNKLEKKGYFSAQRKRSLPKNIKKIGLVTSKTSAAIKDFLTTLKPRNPFIEVFLIDVRVQGKTAAKEISDAIKSFQSFDDIDLIVVTRGGGSKDELFIFNDESICEAAYSSKIPVLSAVGHEIDRSLLDYTADIYCSTPTAAAQKISDYLYISLNTLPIKIENLRKSFSMRFSHEKLLLNNRLSIIENHLMSQIRQGKSNLFEIDRRLDLKLKQIILDEKTKLSQSIRLLESYNVNNVLSRGFAILKSGDRAITSIKDVKEKDKIVIEMEDFSLLVSVDKILKKS